MEGWKEGQTQGVAQVSLGLRCLLADHGGNRYREVEERDRVAFVSLLHPTTGLLSEKNGVVCWVLFSSVITVGNDVLSQPLCFQCWPQLKDCFSGFLCILNVQAVRRNIRMLPELSP
ncbi:hypothetical protein AMECASPLE_036652 [Ameca splendens]|uniref:Uncharacterized protein n=2 Tax=Goodeidae TaxID=28758 RepID=A0ABV0MY83_9TELE